MPAADLESSRHRFLDEVRKGLGAAQGVDDFLAYWRAVESEAAHVEDLGKLERWAQELSRDKDRLQELRHRKQEAEGGQMGDGAMVALIARILAILDDIEARVRRRLLELRGRLGAWVWLAGLGVKSKPAPADDGKTEDKDKKEQTQAALLAKQKTEKDKQPSKSKGT